MRATTFIVATLYAIAAFADAPRIATQAPGWTFTEDEPPEFTFHSEEAENRKSDTALQSPWRLLDWRGREVRHGNWPADGRLELAPLPPGFYRVEPSSTATAPTAAFMAFDFCVVRRDPCRNPESPFAVDSALSHRAETFDCPWYGGNTFPVVCELMRKCGIVQTRERMVWKSMNPEPGVYDYGRRLANVEHLRANGLVTTGIFAGTPAHAGGEEPGHRHLPTDLMALYALMTNAVPTFGDTYNAWGFWNEPDLAMVPEPVWEYVAAFKAFALSVRDADPAKPVLFGALADVPDPGFGEGLAANELVKYTDAFNIHTYLEPARLPQWLADLRKFMGKCGRPELAVWLTEFGTNLEGDSTMDGARPGLKAHSPEQEMVVAEWYPKGAIIMQMGGIARSWLFLFGCYNERGGRKDWGTMRRDGHVKPIHAAISALTGELGNAHMLGEVKVGEGVRAFLYGQPGFADAALSSARQTLVFWSASEIDTVSQGPVHPTGPLEQPFELPLPAAAAASQMSPANPSECALRLIDMMGTPIPCPAPAASGALPLVAERYPQYLTGTLGLSPDIPAAQPGCVRRYEAAPGEDLSVVVRPKLSENDFEIAGRKSRAELVVETGGISVELWNFSHHVKRGRLVAETGEASSPATAAARESTTPDDIVLPPLGHATVPYHYEPQADGPLDVLLSLRFVSDDGASTRAAVPVFDRRRFLAECEVVPLHLEEPAQWQRNDSGQTYSCAYDEAEKAVRFDVGWTGETGPWFMPWHYLRLPEETFEGAKMLEFEVKSEQDKVENDYNSAVVMVTWADGHSEDLHYSPPGFAWEKRRVALPADAGGIASIRLGGAPRGRRLTFWLRNVRLLK